MSKLEIITKDNKNFHVDSRIKNLSLTISNWFESTNDPFHIDLSSEIFEKVIEYCEMHDYNPPKVQKPIKSHILKDNLNEKDLKFVASYDYLTIKPLLDAAFYLVMNSLREVCICVIATEFYIGNTIDDIERLKAKFGVESDLTLEEEEALIKEYPWAQDDEGDSKLETEEVMMVEEEAKS
jgi:SCF ubiquitin ligase, SKP1 component